MGISRRATLGALGGAGLLATMRRQARAEDGPIRIGLIAPLSSSAQVYGTPIRDGAEIAVERLNDAGGILGRKLELVARDDHGSASASLEAFYDLRSAGVHLLAAGPFSSSILALLPQLQSSEAALVAVATSGLSVTHEAYNPNAFRMGFTSYMSYRGLARVMAEKYPDVTKWAIIVPDAEAMRDIGNQMSLGLQEYYPKRTGKPAEIVKTILTRVGATDYRAQIGELMQTDAQGVFSSILGADGISFYSQAHSMGMDQKYKVMADAGLELSIPKALKRNTPRNLWSFTGWYHDADKTNKVSQDLYARYVKKTGDEFPNWYTGVAHDAVLAIAEGVAKSGSTDAAPVIAAIAANRPYGATGTIDFRQADHQLLGSMYYVNFGGDASDPQGWKVFQTVILPGADLAEPATPGRKLDT